GGGAAGRGSAGPPGRPGRAAAGPRRPRRRVPAPAPPPAWAWQTRAARAGLARPSGVPRPVLPGGIFCITMSPWPVGGVRVQRVAEPAVRGLLPVQPEPGLGGGTADDERQRG